MLYVLPDYYPEFHCRAGECEDTCCAGWQIVIDRQSLRRYRAYRGSFRRRLFLSVQWKKKILRQDGRKRCAFLNQENLCDLYTNLGADSLCRTCRLYPRHIEEYENVREISLSVSCPEAARLLLTRKEPVRFREFWRDKEEDYEEDYEEFDELLYSVLTDCRKVMLEVLQNRALPLRQRCGLITGLAHDVQNRFDRGDLFSCQDLFDRFERILPSDADGKTISFHRWLLETESKMNIRKNRNFPWIREMFSFLSELEVLKEDWPLWLEETQDWLYRGGQAAYEQIEGEFLVWLEKDDQNWELPFEQLLVYFLFVYFCGAVYDGEILASAQLGVVHVWLIREMLMAVWLRNGKSLRLEDMTDLVCRYSRELEHSDVNQKKIEKKMSHCRLPWLS